MRALAYWRRWSLAARVAYWRETAAYAVEVFRRVVLGEHS